MYREPNVVLLFSVEDTERIREVLDGIYNFKEKGTHSPTTRHEKQYWEMGEPGFVYAYVYNPQYAYAGSGYRRQPWARTIKKLNESGIEYSWKRI